MSETLSPAVPNPRDADCFRFLGCDYNPATGLACLSYAFNGGPELVERLTFPHAPWPPEASRQACFRRALEILHLVAGVSYYKAGLSRRIELQDPHSIDGISPFLTELYVKGLGELGYVNQVGIDGRVNFPAAGAAGIERPPAARPLILPERALVAMGGGKDSLVGLDRLQKAGIEVMPVCVGNSVLIGDTVKATGLPLIRIGRVLAPELAEMNQVGAWNGHIPVTAVNSAILLCAAILYGFRYIVFSNERSADEATLVTAAGQAVNHQYSKGSAFEASFRNVIAEQVSPDIEYFSVLRQYSELGVVRRFSAMKKFHPVYSSCNRNFHQDGPRVENRWCLDCPKCRFAALSLATFLSPDEVIAIQGGDLLNNPAQQDGFRALCSLGRDKPFECVGEAGESRAALAVLGAGRHWCRHAVVRALLPELDQVDVPVLDALLQPSGRHFIPPHILSRMNVAEAVSGRVAILGIGREGQAAWRFLRTLYPDMQISLLAESAPDPGFMEQLSVNDRVIIGPLSEAGLEGFDTLVRSPGISPYRDSLQRARNTGAGITSPSNLWFASHPDQKTICITGTKGKSTTAAMLAHMLQACGYRVRLAGNIGLPLLSCDDREVDWWVVELSSYQLTDLEASPTIPVILNLSPEHLDWHRGEQNYREDKLRLARLSGRQSLVANASDPVLAESLSGYRNSIWFNTPGGFRVEGGRLFDGKTPLQPDVPEGLPGVHNLSNIAAALTVLRVIGADLAEGMRSIASFRSLPHRLQTVGERAGVRFINDSISSTPVATVAALEAFAGQKITLLVGGLDRGLDWTPYFSRIKVLLPDAIIGIPDNGPRIIREMRGAGIRPENGIHEVADLEAAVRLAGKLALPGGLVLLSPGAPSFPRYNDYRDRGRQFTLLSGFEFSEWEPFSPA
jgi:UDP-N-acetylmuramoylalanine--D-glutamate ligase